MIGDVELTTILCSEIGALEGRQWGGAGTYPESVVGVFYGRIESSPDRAVGVAVYDTADDARDYVRARRVQVRSRGARDDPAGADALADEHVPLLVGLSRHRGLLHVEWLSSARLGADDNGREERTDNFLITLDNEEAS
ncbi:hypothetical protein L332_03610 [Agrococcus pavilionensis RW1]|uniref:DUF3168 domain-containing protein n=1 Tax=Agrococcus pavilionensis RW1 TaxID=1330458 RepID=U1L976_9MICO|nr:minor capsid protein [Agrococcus pavilionensis]ERG63538.1 hypothetical protein L332_03610 [Agrococcus pavilionensis RW1]